MIHQYKFVSSVSWAPTIWCLLKFLSFVCCNNWIYTWISSMNPWVSWIWSLLFSSFYPGQVVKWLLLSKRAKQAHCWPLQHVTPLEADLLTFVWSLSTKPPHPLWTSVGLGAHFFSMERILLCAFLHLSFVAQLEQSLLQLKLLCAVVNVVYWMSYLKHAEDRSMFSLQKYLLKKLLSNARLSSNKTSKIEFSVCIFLWTAVKIK